MSNMNETKKKLKCAVDIGEALLMNGGEIYRVEETINHINFHPLAFILF